MTTTPTTETLFEQLSTLYDADELTRAEYRDALKSLYASETDMQQLGRIRAQFVRVSIPTAAS